MNQHKGANAKEDNDDTFVKKGKSYFFGIGINDYKEFPVLFNAKKDIEDVAALLSEHYYFEESDIQLLKNEDATRENIIEELSAYNHKLTPDDRLLIYFSGHGFMDKKTELGYWIPADARKDKISSYVSNAEVREQLKPFNAKHILLISDSCFSASLLARDASRDIGSAYTDWERNPSRWVFISGKGIVSDGKKGENSPFAAGILKHLSQNKDEAINIARLADEVTKEIKFNDEQQAELSPLFNAGHKGGQFVFLKRQTEKDDWKTALQKNTESAYLHFIEKHPKGSFLAQANENLEQIADLREWQNALRKDAAFAYLQYLKEYPKGKYADIAKSKIEAIKNVERIENEKIAAIAAAEKERKEKERKDAIAKAKKEKELLLLKEKQEKEQAEEVSKEKSRQAAEEKPLQEEKEKQEAIVVATITTVTTPVVTPTTQPFGSQTVDSEVIPAATPSRKFPLAIASSVLIAVFVVMWLITKPASTENAVTTPTKNDPYAADSIKKYEENKVNSERVQVKPDIKPTTKTESKNIEKEKPITPIFDVASARSALNSAKAAAASEDKSDALIALKKAANISGLPKATLDAINSAKAALGSDDYDDAKSAIQKAINSF
jgi:hypothetical protein